MAVVEIKRSAVVFKTKYYDYRLNSRIASAWFSMYYKGRGSSIILVGDKKVLKLIHQIVYLSKNKCCSFLRVMRKQVYRKRIDIDELLRYTTEMLIAKEL